MAPLRFTRELACVDSRLRPLRSPQCRGFRALRADGFALHPYSLDTAPAAADGSDRVQIGELAKLTSLLGELERRGRVERPLPLYLTEYGYQTDPPDPGKISQALAGRYEGQALMLGWRAARTRMFPQFLLYDIGPDRSHPAGSARRWGGYQTGLYSYRGAPKPEVVRGFRLPFHALAVSDERGQAAVAVFGQVRPGRGTQTVEIQRQRPGRVVGRGALHGSRGDARQRAAAPSPPTARASTGGSWPTRARAATAPAGTCRAGEPAPARRRRWAVRYPSAAGPWERSHAWVTMA